MKYDARFSVVLPLSSLDSNCLDSFEEMCQRYRLAVELPISLNHRGDLYIVSSGLSLRDAQMLRRQIAGIGFPADVIADEVNGEEKVTTSSLNTLVVESDVFEANRPEDVGDIMSSAWETLEIPAADDVNLEDLVTRTPEMLVEEETANNSTKGVSFMELMKAARENEDSSNTGGDFGFHALDGGFLIDSKSHASNKDKKDPADVFSFLDDDLSGKDRHQETLNLIQARLTPATPQATKPVSSSLNHAVSSSMNKKVNVFEDDDDNDDDEVTVIRAVSNHLVADSFKAGPLDDFVIDVDLSEMNGATEAPKQSVVDKKITVSEENAQKEESQKETPHPVAEKQDTAIAKETEKETDKKTEPENKSDTETPVQEAEKESAVSEKKEAAVEVPAQAEQSKQETDHEHSPDKTSVEDKKTPDPEETGHPAASNETKEDKPKEHSESKLSESPSPKDKDTDKEKRSAIDRSKFEAQNDSVVQKDANDMLRYVHIVLLAAAALLIVLTLIHIFVTPLSVISALTVSN